TPLPSRSPSGATLLGKPQVSSRFGRLTSRGVECLIVLRTEPSAFMNKIHNQPLDRYGAPTARSGTPSLFRSPNSAAHAPNRSSKLRTGPPPAIELILRSETTVPVSSIERRQRAPAFS